ncbi:Fc.00g009160.m01.CDS01 [Cosmosporella sp. VM-42]
MKIAVVLFFVTSALAGLFEKRACAGNNCKRQVTGTRAGLLAITSRQADCSSFMAHTVVPDGTTTTITVTINPGEVDFARRKRTIEARETTKVPTAIPAYASSCTNVAEYSAACSCWGITAVTTTAPKPTSTETVTSTQDFCEDL